MPSLPNLITVDLDDRRPGIEPTHIEPAVDALTEALQRSSTPATFFASQSFATSRADLVRSIASAGHEIACLSTLAPVGQKPYSASFRENLLATKATIEDTTGRRARGHRIAGFALNAESEWTYDVLVDEGIEYDSSRFPTRHTDHGELPVPATVHAVQRWGGTLLEIPPTTADVLALRV